MRIDSNQLKLLMARNTITISELAKNSSLSRIFIGNCLKGNANPKPATIGKIAQGLGVDVTELLENATAMAGKTTP